MNQREHEKRDDLKVWLSQNEVEALLDAATDTEQRLAFALGARCGLRSHETPLKNEVNGEWPVSLSEDVVEIVEDYRRVNRPDVTDENGRESLIAPRYGRMSISAMRSLVYRMT